MKMFLIYISFSIDLVDENLKPIDQTLLHFTISGNIKD